jgi:hypothetical protein
VQQTGCRRCCGAQITSKGVTQDPVRPSVGIAEKARRPWRASLGSASRRGGGTSGRVPPHRPTMGRHDSTRDRPSPDLPRRGRRRGRDGRAALLSLRIDRHGGVFGVPDTTRGRGSDLVRSRPGGCRRPRRAGRSGFPEVFSGEPGSGFVRGASRGDASVPGRRRRGSTTTGRP